VTGLPEQVNDLHLIGVALGAGLGAVCRAAVDRTVVARFGPTRLPWATLAVNVVGSFVLGLLLALTAVTIAAPGPAAESAETWRLVVGTGFAGGLTTFSTFSLESFLLLREGRPRGALSYAVLTVGLGMGAVILGEWLGATLR
jgi:CrcB protein